MKKMLGLRVSAKISYFAKLAARERLMSINEFVEHALWEAIQTPEEPDYDNAFTPPAQMVPGRFEGLYDDDEAVRFYLLGSMQPDLFNPDEARLWKLLTGGIERAGQTLTIEAFTAAYDGVNVDKTHLERE
jgi:hypothetical protein